MKYLLFLLLVLSGTASAEHGDVTGRGLDLELPGEIGNTRCDFYNRLDPSSEEGMFMNKYYQSWVEGWVGAFTIYTGVPIRHIDDSEYVTFLSDYCFKHPTDSLADAADYFVYTVTEKTAKAKAD